MSDDAALAARQRALGAEISAQMAAGDFPAALRAQHQLVDLLTEVAQRLPWHRRQLALETLNLAMVQERAGQRGAAVRSARAARDLFARVRDEDDHRFAPEVELAARELRRLHLVRLFLQPRRR
jgi:cation transport regulator ChaB